MRNILLAASLLFGAAAACSSAPDSPAPDAPAVIPVDPATGLRIADLGPVPPLPAWPDNPPSAEKHALGKALFGDPRLSGSGRTTCGACHFAPGEFQSGNPLDLPDRSFPNNAPSLSRHTPSLLNVVYAPMMRWDGSHFTDLYEMAVLPFAEGNMNTSRTLPASSVEAVDIPGAKQALYAKLTVDNPGYKAAFAGAFGEDIAKATPEEVWRLAGKAIAVYLRVAVSRDAPFDRWNAGDDSAIKADALRGLELFRGKAKCILCHSGPFLSDFEFHNVGTSPPAANGARADEGRYAVTGRDVDRGAFLTPSLRSVAKTSPYFHDGSETALVNVIRRKSGPSAVADPNREPVLESVPALSDGELGDLVAFLKTLNGVPISVAEVTSAATLP